MTKKNFRKSHTVSKTYFFLENSFLEFSNFSVIALYLQNALFPLKQRDTSIEKKNVGESRTAPKNPLLLQAFKNGLCETQTPSASWTSENPS